MIDEQPLPRGAAAILHPQSNRQYRCDRWTQSVFKRQLDIDLRPLVDPALPCRHNIRRPAVAMFP